MVEGHWLETWRTARGKAFSKPDFEKLRDLFQPWRLHTDDDGCGTLQMINILLLVLVYLRWRKWMADLLD